MKFMRFLIVLLVFACSKDSDVAPVQQNEEDEGDPTEIIDLTITLNSVSPWKALFDVVIPGEHQNKKLIWGTTSNPTVNANLNRVSVENNQATAFRLIPGGTYYFRAASIFQGIVHYSEAFELTLPIPTPAVDQQLNVNTSFSGFERMVKTTDGGYVAAFTMFSQGGVGSKIRIAKFDANFNTEWQKIVDKTIRNDMLRGLVATSDNAVMVMVNFFEPSGGPPYNQYRSYITKLDGNGDEEWTNYYQFKEGNDEVHYVNHFYDIRETGDPVRFTIQSDSTRYQNGDSFAWEATIDLDGNVLNRFTIENDISFRLAILQYDDSGNKYNVGPSDDLIFMDKYDNQGEMMWTKDFTEYIGMSSGGDYFVGEDYFAFASWIDSGENTDLIFKTDAQGNPLWDYKIRNDTLVELPTTNITFRAKRIREIANKELLALIQDHEGSSMTTISENGVVQWRYSVPSDNNGIFMAEDYFVDGTTITLFGYQNSIEGAFWVKQYDLTDL